jgi:hypothetical protein
MQQLDFFTAIEPAYPVVFECEHEHGFHSNAHVPGGYFCSGCNMIVIRDMPPPVNQPDLIGYISANWAWKYVHGNEWTSDDQH